MTPAPSLALMAAPAEISHATTVAHDPARRRSALAVLAWDKADCALALDEGVDFFQVQGAAARERLEI